MTSVYLKPCPWPIPFVAKLTILGAKRKNRPQEGPSGNTQARPRAMPGECLFGKVWLMVGIEKEWLQRSTWNINPFAARKRRDFRQIFTINGGKKLKKRPAVARESLFFFINKSTLFFLYIYYIQEVLSIWATLK